MERGLIWLPLLGLIIGLTWAGWKEYQKVENYRLWAEEFDQAKYDLYAVIGLKDKVITWGKATAKGISDLQTFSLNDVQEINVLVGDRKIEPDQIIEQKTKDTPQLAFTLAENQILIPFTELDLAIKWQEYLKSL